MKPMASSLPIIAVVPVKETGAAKQRLAPALSPETRQSLALAMLDDVLDALAAASSLAGVIVVTTDTAARTRAERRGAAISTEGASDGHTGAVMAAARRLATRGAALLTIPGDVPLVRATDIDNLVAAHRSSEGFTIVPARDERGSNAILCSPANAVPLCFGENSYFPHLDAARRRGIEPLAVPLPRIALDIDCPDDLIEFLTAPDQTRAGALLRRLGISACSLMAELGS